MNNRILPPVLAALALVALPAAANMPDRVVIDQAPPAASAEVTPPAREGYVWAPGYYTWTGSKHEWKKGHFIAARKGYRYEPARWAQEDGRWTLYPEQWVKNEDDKAKTVAKDSSQPELPK